MTWTDALEAGFRPARAAADNMPDGGVTAFTAVIILAAAGKGTRYTALAMHKTEAERNP